MSRRTLPVLLALAAVAALLLAPTGRVVAQRLQQVIVTNFPEIQKIKGTVSVAGPVHLSFMESFPDIVVPPVQATDTTRMVDAGVVVTGGFPELVLSLHGVVRGSVQKPGTVGAILIPEQESIQEAFHQHGMMHFALETTAGGVSSKTPYFASNQPRFTVGFSSYRIFLYNTTDKTITANLFVYLTS